MDYFINKKKGMVIGLDGENVFLFEKISAGGGPEREVVEKKRGGRPRKVREEIEETRGVGKRQRMTPEIIGKIKEQITKGESPAVIAEEYGVNISSVYQLKSKMKTMSTSDTFSGRGEEEEN